MIAWQRAAAAAAVMCAYPAAYGVPSCAHPFNGQVLRGEWGWDGALLRSTVRDTPTLGLPDASSYAFVTTPRTL